MRKKVNGCDGSPNTIMTLLCKKRTIPDTNFLPYYYINDHTILHVCMLFLVDKQKIYFYNFSQTNGVCSN